MDALNEKVSGLESQISTLQSENETLKNQVSGLKSENETLKNERESLAAEVLALKASKGEEIQEEPAPISSVDKFKAKLTAPSNGSKY